MYNIWYSHVVHVYMWYSSTVHVYTLYSCIVHINYIVAFVVCFRTLNNIVKITPNIYHM